MSHEASSWAVRQTVGSQGPKMLLVMLANHADKAGVCYPGQALLAAECECRRETISRHMKHLEDAGLIVRLERRRLNRSRTSDWVVLAPGMECGEMIPPNAEDYPAAVVEARSCAKSSCEDFAPSHVRISGGPEPSVEPSALRGRENARVRIAGKPVDPAAWALVAGVLAEFNAQTGRKLRLLTSAGEASDAAKRIHRCVKAYPDIDAAKYADIIRRTLASQWWGTDEPGIGVVFGPKVFEDNITRPGIQRRRPGSTSSGDLIAVLNAKIGDRP